LWRQQFILEDVSGCPEKSVSNNWVITFAQTALRLSNFLFLKTVAGFLEIGWNS
jgi:hypothetical protein